MQAARRGPRHEPVPEDAELVAAARRGPRHEPVPEDAELVQAARRGDRDAFNELVRSTYRDLYALAYRLTGNREDAGDVVQDAYVRAYRAIRRFRGDSSFSTWMYRITSNCASTCLSRRSRQRTEELTSDAPIVDLRPEQDPALRTEAAVLRQHMDRAIRALPERLRQVVVLRDLHDLSHNEIAGELGITATAAKVRLHRARQRLRTVLHHTTESASGPVVLPMRDEQDNEKDKEVS